MRRLGSSSLNANDASGTGRVKFLAYLQNLDGRLPDDIRGRTNFMRRVSAKQSDVKYPVSDLNTRRNFNEHRVWHFRPLHTTPQARKPLARASTGFTSALDVISDETAVAS